MIAGGPIASRPIATNFATIIIVIIVIPVVTNTMQFSWFIAEPIYMGDVGTLFKCLVRDSDGSIKDISSAEVLTILLLAPDEILYSHDLDFTTDGTDGLAQYITVSESNLPTEGWWKLQGYIEIGDNKQHTNQEKFQILDIIN